MWVHFHNFCIQNEAVCCEVQTHCGSSLLARFTKILGAFYFYDLCPKTKLFAMTFRRILKVLCLQVLQKKLLVHYHDLCVQRCSCLLLSSDAFQKFSPCEVYKKVLSALSRLLLPKTKLFALKIRRILDVLSLQVLQKRFWAHYNDFCVHKRSILPLSSDAF